MLLNHKSPLDALKIMVKSAFVFATFILNVCLLVHCHIGKNWYQNTLPNSDILYWSFLPLGNTCIQGNTAVGCLATYGKNQYR